MGGVDYNMNVLQRSLGTGASAGSMVIGIRPAFGYGKLEEGTAMALSVDAPISVSMKVGQRINAVPFLAPGLGYGRLSPEEGDSESGTKMSLGGGIGFTNVVGNMGLNVGFRKIFVDEAPTQFGLGMSWTR
jgi:hypothetical protein